ncbi:HD domain-containing phosphohydrolase [Kosmotoga pacifica]|uniref:HD domain-containing phosphohydrolase n=1 Tax=Kosmotoga pacifica TaxID=1330330 RepID=UPI00069A47B7|nr:HD domain-containing phosphohydrolase [Kosmotoga pacifica]
MNDESDRLNLPAFSPEKYGDIPNPFWIMDSGGKIIFANVCFLRFFRRTREQVQGKPLEEVIERRSARNISRLFRLLLKKGETVKEQMLLTGATNTGYFSVTLVPVFKNRNLSHVIGHAFDLTPLENRCAEIIRDRTSFVNVLARVSERTLPETNRHLRIISEASAMMAMVLKEKYPREITKEFVENIRGASLLHDIGNLEIPSELLLKEEKLSTGEYQKVKEHTIKGVELIKNSPGDPNSAFLTMCVEIIEYHHEAFDGSGYPRGLSGEDIPLPARIASVADNYASMRVKRPYRDSLQRDKVLEIIYSEKGKKFDPIVIDAFLSIEKELNALTELE